MTASMNMVDFEIQLRASVMLRRARRPADVSYRSTVAVEVPTLSRSDVRLVATNYGREILRHGTGLYVRRDLVTRPEDVDAGAYPEGHADLSGAPTVLQDHSTLPFLDDVHRRADVKTVLEEDVGDGLGWWTRKLGGAWFRLGDETWQRLARPPCFRVSLKGGWTDPPSGQVAPWFGALDKPPSSRHVCSHLPFHRADLAREWCRRLGASGTFVMNAIDHVQVHDTATFEELSPPSFRMLAADLRADRTLFRSLVWDLGEEGEAALPKEIAVLAQAFLRSDDDMEFLDAVAGLVKAGADGYGPLGRFASMAGSRAMRWTAIDRPDVAWMRQDEDVLATPIL